MVPPPLSEMCAAPVGAQNAFSGARCSGPIAQKSLTFFHSARRRESKTACSRRINANTGIVEATRVAITAAGKAKRIGIPPLKRIFRDGRSMRRPPRRLSLISVADKKDMKSDVILLSSSARSGRDRDRTDRTFGCSSHADVAPVQDEPMMSVAPVAGRHRAFETLLHLEGRASRRERQPVGDAKICVSTAIVSSPKATFRTTFAVLRPTPGRASKASRSRGHFPVPLDDAFESASTFLALVR